MVSERDTNYLFSEILETYIYFVGMSFKREGDSLASPHVLDGTNYTYWEQMMKEFGNTYLLDILHPPELTKMVLNL